VKYVFVFENHIISCLRLFGGQGTAEEMPHSKTLWKPQRDFQTKTKTAPSEGYVEGAEETNDVRSETCRNGRFHVGPPKNSDCGI